MTLLQTDAVQSPGFTHLTLASLSSSGTAYWVDSRNTASTYRLYECVRDERRLSGLQIARAFTAYQHFTLCQRLCRAATTEPDLVCLPNIASLYRDADVPAHERDELFAAVITGLTTLADTCDLRLLVSTAVDDALTDQLAQAADHVLTATQTPFGCRFDGDEIETTAYPTRGGWQTTIPYWVELFGTVDEATFIETVEQTEFAGVA